MKQNDYFEKIKGRGTNIGTMKQIPSNTPMEAQI